MSVTLLKQITQLLPLAIIIAGLLGQNFLSAQWQASTAVAPNNNTEAPINVSANYQAKLGDLGAVRMRACQYCNADGTVCVTDVQGRVSSACPAGQAIRSINADGTVACQTTTTSTPAISCTTSYTTASAYVYGSGSPACPAGFTRSGPSYGGGSCSTNNTTWYTPCIRTVCS